MPWPTVGHFTNKESCQLGLYHATSTNLIFNFSDLHSNKYSTVAILCPQRVTKTVEINGHKQFSSSTICVHSHDSCRLSFSQNEPQALSWLQFRTKITHNFLNTQIKSSHASIYSLHLSKS